MVSNTIVENDYDLRPQTLKDFLGQEKTRALLEVYIKSAKDRKVVLDHLLFYGPPGVGKTTLARVIAAELGVPFVQAIAPNIESPMKLQEILLGLNARSVFFIDEIHGLSRKMSEVLYSAMEDQEIHVSLVDTANGKDTPVTVVLNPFTLIGATTRPDLLQAPLRDRFGILMALEPYTQDEMAAILKRGAGLMGLKMSDEGVEALAMRSRGVPRIGGRLLRRLRDFALTDRPVLIGPEYVCKVMESLGIDSLGLDRTDHKYLTALRDAFGGGPAGVEAIASQIGESTPTVGGIIEPYLLNLGLIQRTGAGRKLTPEGLKALGSREL